MRVLQLDMTTATGGPGLICQILAQSIPIVPGMAVEIIEQIDATTPTSIGNHETYSLLLKETATAVTAFVSPPDQNRWGSLGQAPAARSPAITRCGPVSRTGEALTARC